MGKTEKGSKSTGGQESSAQPGVDLKEEPSKRKSNRGCWILAGIGCVVALVITVGIAAALVSAIVYTSSGLSIGETVLSEGSGGTLVVIPVEGVITESSSDASFLSTGGAVSGRLINLINKAQDDPTVSAVLLRMNTPGGEVVASDLVYRKLMELRERKPVVTWMSGMGASGGYYIASASDHIVVHPDTITGSIGVILEVTNLEGLYEKLGIESRIFKSDELKDAELLFDGDPDGEADTVYQSLVDEAYEAFISAVSEGRGMDIAEVRRLGDGRVYTGRQVVANGLADSSGDFEDAVDIAGEITGLEDLRVIEYTTGGFWESLYGYEQAILEKIGLSVPVRPVGVHLYYLLSL